MMFVGDEDDEPLNLVFDHLRATPLVSHNHRKRDQPPRRGKKKKGSCLGGRTGRGAVERSAYGLAGGPARRARRADG